MTIQSLDVAIRCRLPRMTIQSLDVAIRCRLPRMTIQSRDVAIRCRLPRMTIQSYGKVVSWNGDLLSGFPSLSPSPPPPPLSLSLSLLFSSRILLSVLRTPHHFVLKLQVPLSGLVFLSCIQTQTQTQTQTYLFRQDCRKSKVHYLSRLRSCEEGREQD